MLNKIKAKCVFGGLLATALACTTTAAIAASGSVVGGNVAGWVKDAKLIGTAPSSQSVEIAVHMALNNTPGLQSFVADISDPNSKSYGRYLTPDEFAQRFAPAASAVAQVKALLEKAGMTNLHVGPYGVYVSAQATVAQLGTAFKVSQNLYSYKGMTLRANKEEPTIPATLAGYIVYIEGLDDTTMLRTPFHKSVTQGPRVPPAAALSRSGAKASAVVTPPPVAAGNPSPYCNKYYGADMSVLVGNLSTPANVYGGAIPWLNCGYNPTQIRYAYGLNQVKYDGSDVTVAIVDAYASPTLLDDANRYSTNHTLPALTTGVNFSQIIPSGIYDVNPAASCDPYDWWGEQSLDVDAVHGSAPGAKIVFVGSVDCGTSLDTAFMDTIYNRVADVVTDSWGDNGESIAPGSQTAYDNAALAGAAEGVTILFSSGDDGDLSAANGVASGSWPATSAWVTGVGGTTLLFKDWSGAKDEYGWGTYRAFLDDATVDSATSITTSGVAQTSAYGYTFDDYTFYSGSGGGISLLESQPTYQAKAVPAYLATTLNLASGYTETLPTAMRVSPDVAMDADPYTGYLYGETFTIAGNAIADAGCTPISKTEEYCEGSIGGTSLASPLMAGVVAVVNQKRKESGRPLVGFANPLLYSIGSHGESISFNHAINQIIAPTQPVALLRGYTSDLTEVRVITVNSVPFNITTAPYAIEVCGLTVCEGVDDVWNYTSQSSASVPPTPAGYNDVTGLGVPNVYYLVEE